MTETVKADHLEYHCPPWAYDTANPSDRPCRDELWQPRWQPLKHRRPLPGRETDVARILTELEIVWTYEPLLVPIPRPQRLDDPFLKRRSNRRVIMPDFYLPRHNLFIEVYEGGSEHRRDMKERRLTRMERHHGARFLLITPAECSLLDDAPELLLDWIQQTSTTPKLSA